MYTQDLHPTDRDQIKPFVKPCPCKILKYRFIVFVFLCVSFSLFSFNTVFCAVGRSYIDSDAGNSVQRLRP